MEPFDAIVLAGGQGRRLGGVDKAALMVGGRPLLDLALHAVSGASRVVVVGPARRLPRGLEWVSEDPPGGGPVAAIAAAMPHVESQVVVVLACDMPFVTTRTVELLAAAASAGRSGSLAPGVLDGALLVDERGRRQFLAAAYRTTALAGALHQLGRPDGAAMRHVVRHLTVTEVATDPEVTLDCDTWDDVGHSRDLLEGR